MSILDVLVFVADPCTCETVRLCGHCACDVCLECGNCSGGDGCVCPCRRAELEEA